MKKIILYLFGLIIGLTAVPGWSQLYSDNFDSYAAGSVPTGWTSYTTQTDDPGFQVVADTGIARSPYQILAHLGVNINQESTSWIVSPAFNIGSNQELIFYWREKWAYAYNYSGVYISTASSDPISNPNDFVELAEFNPNNYPTWNEWNKAMFDLRSYANQTVYIAFKYTGDFAHDFYVDDFQISDIPYCNPTTSIDVTAYTDTTLDVVWDAVSGVDQYEIVWGPTGFDPNTGTPELVTGNNYTITGLQPATWYDIYVRAYCSSYNYSSWAGPEPGRTSGPPPANDTCAGAINLTVYPALGGSVGHETVGDTWDATPSAMSQTSCDSYGTNLDLFYTFTAPADGNLVILTDSTRGGNIEAAIYDSCGGNELFCFGQGHRKMVTGLTPGQNYVLQVWHDDYYKGVFTIALEELPPPPSNNECSAADTLTVYPAGGGAGNETDGDTSYATASSMSQTSCDSYGTNLDLFYAFTAPSVGTVKVITGGQQGNYIEAAVYDGCGGNEIGCQGQGTEKIFGGLTPGQTYILQVWHDEGYEGPFNIVIEEGPATPANDDCSGATALTVYPSGGGAGHETDGDTNAATASSMSHTSCDGYGTNLDLFYTFVAPAGGSVLIHTGGTGGPDIEAAVYDSCGGNEIACFGNSSDKIVSGLTPGQTYVLQVWHDDFNAASFNIVLEEGPSAPANDFCSGGIVVTVNSTTCSNVITASNIAASDSGVPAPSCAYYQGGDIWFKVVVPASGHVEMETVNVGGFSDSGMAYYTGSCSNLTEVDCNDDGGSGLMSRLVADGYTPGDTLYVRVWEYGNNSYGNVGFCAYDPNYTSVQDLTAKGFTFYPNPTEGRITLSANEAIDRVEITGITGQVLYREELHSVSRSLDISRLPSGVYLMNVYIGNDKGTYRIVKE